MTIYKNSLDQPDARVDISVVNTGNYGKILENTCFHTSTVIKNYTKKTWNYSQNNISEIKAEMENDGFECTETKDAYGNPYLRCFHKETLAHIVAIKNAYADKFKHAESGFIRFGDIPQTGFSVNHRNNQQELGVSVYPAKFVENDYSVLFTPAGEGTYLFSKLAERPVYRVYGEVVGTGSDGEPVLKITKTIKL